MKKVNSLVGRAITFLTLLLAFASCSKKDAVITPIEPPVHYTKPTILWNVSIDTTHRFLQGNFQMFQKETLTVSISAINATSYRILETGTNSVSINETLGDQTYTATASGKGGDTTTSYKLVRMSVNKDFLCKGSPKWRMSVSKIAHTSDSLAEPSPAEWADGLLDSNTANRYYPDNTGDITTFTGPTAGVHPMNKGYQLIYGDTHMIYDGDFPWKIESINADTLVLGQVQKYMSGTTVMWAHYRRTYLRMP